MKNVRSYAPVVVRIGTGLVVLWFGVNQLLHPELFHGYIPSWFTLLSAPTLLMVNGLFEVVIGVCLLLGLLTRVAAGLHALHLLGIIVALGYGDIAVRDVGLLFAAVAVALHGPDQWCLDRKLFSKSI